MCRALKKTFTCKIECVKHSKITFTGKILNVYNFITN